MPKIPFVNTYNFITTKSTLSEGSLFAKNLPIFLDIFTRLRQDAPYGSTGRNGILRIPLPWREGLGEGDREYRSLHSHRSAEPVEA